MLELMVHGSCNYRCKKDNRCSKRFPKAPCPRPYFDEEGFSVYRRACERTATKGTRQIDDKLIVPYNPAIPLIMQCHCNVEWASSAHCVLCISKYMLKGRSRAACSGSKFTSIERWPAVEALVVPLEERNRVYFTQGRKAEAALGSPPSGLELHLARPEPLQSLRFVELYNRATQPLKTLPSYFILTKGRHLCSAP